MNNNGKRKTSDGARQRTTSALIRRITAASAKVAGVLAAALVALCGMPAGASAETEANTGSAPIEAVPESEFEPIGYEASIDFDEIEIVKGFEEAEDVGIYFDHRYSDGDNPSLDDLYLQVKGHPGLAFPIDESTEKGIGRIALHGRHVQRRGVRCHRHDFRLDLSRARLRMGKLRPVLRRARSVPAGRVSEHVLEIAFRRSRRLSKFGSSVVSVGEIPA